MFEFIEIQTVDRFMVINVRDILRFYVNGETTVVVMNDRVCHDLPDKGAYDRLKDVLSVGKLNP